MPFDRKAYGKEYYVRNRRTILARSRAYLRQLKVDVLMHYSEGRMRCECCGEFRIEFLCLDHINGGGRKHRESLPNRGSGFYGHLRSSGYPSGLRVLCHNCNMAIGHYGSCPHGSPTFLQEQEVMASVR